MGDVSRVGEAAGGDGLRVVPCVLIFGRDSVWLCGLGTGVEDDRFGVADVTLDGQLVQEGRAGVKESGEIVEPLTERRLLSVPEVV